MFLLKNIPTLAHALKKALRLTEMSQLLLAVFPCLGFWFCKHPWLESLQFFTVHTDRDLSGVLSG